MPLLIKNGEIITPSERYIADILCENETITRVDCSLVPRCWFDNSATVSSAGKTCWLN